MTWEMNKNFPVECDTTINNAIINVASTNDKNMLQKEGYIRLEYILLFMI